MHQESDKEYVPSEHEQYMCDKHLEYFSKILEEQRRKVQLSISQLQEEIALLSSENKEDYVSSSNMQESAVWAIEKQYKQLTEIEEALSRIKNKRFGFCIRSREPIGIKRLLVVPTAKTSIKSNG